MRINYNPVPGGVADKVIRWLFTQPYGMWHTNRRVSEECGVPLPGLQSSLAAAERADVLVRGWAPNGYLCWHLGPVHAQTPPIPTAETVDRYDPSAPHEPAEAVPEPIVVPDEPEPVDEADLDAEAGGEPEPEADPDHFACAWYSDGRFHIEQGPESVTLTPAQFHVLEEYISRLNTYPLDEPQQVAA